MVEIIRENFKSIALPEMVEILTLEYEGIKEGLKPINPLLWGLPGIGKTEVISQFCQRIHKQNPNFAEEPLVFITSTKDAADMGIPFIQNDTVTQNKVIEWIRPKIFNLPKDWEGILFFDEFNLGQPAVLNACQQLFNDRKLDNFELPKGAMIVAAANPSSCNFNATPLSQPLMDRFTHFDIACNLDAWVVWALNHGINPDLVNFIYKQRPELFYDIQGMEQGNKAFATPRSWCKVSEKLNQLISKYGKVTEGMGYEIASYLFQGLIGQATTTALLAYFRDIARFQDPEEIFVEGKDFKNDKDLNSLYGCIIACITRIPTQNKIDIKTAIHNFAVALSKIKNAEIRAFSSKILVKVDVIEQNISLEDQMLILEGQK